MKEFDLIDKYFDDLLNPKEQLLFNDLLQNSEKFKTEFLFQKNLKMAVTDSQLKDLKSTLQDFEKKIETKTKIIAFRKNWIIAASIIIIVGLGFVYFKTTFYPSTKRIYAQNFVPYRNVIQPIVRGEASNTIEYSAFLAYENGNYHKAVNLFNSIEDQNLNYIPLYKAMCYLSLDKPSKAISLLIPLVSAQNQDSSCPVENIDKTANWFLALSYLKNDEKEKAITRFSITANYPENSCLKIEDAKKILAYLK